VDVRHERDVTIGQAHVIKQFENEEIAAAAVESHVRAVDELRANVFYGRALI
jgi:hypothetical protein